MLIALIFTAYVTERSVQFHIHAQHLTQVLEYHVIVDGLGSAVIGLVNCLAGKIIILESLLYTKLSKRQVRSHFETYNLEHSLNLPQDFKLLYTHTSSAIDGYETLIVVSPKADYKLEYKDQCDSQIHEEFDILEHFYKASDNTEELNTYARQLSDNYDWYAYEERKETRTYNLFVVYDKDNNYLFVYFISTQYTDLF